VGSESLRILTAGPRKLVKAETSEQDLGRGPEGLGSQAPEFQPWDQGCYKDRLPASPFKTWMRCLDTVPHLAQGGQCPGHLPGTAQ
jgi:hypothetical protein